MPRRPLPAVGGGGGVDASRDTATNPFLAVSASRTISATAAATTANGNKKETVVTPEVMRRALARAPSATATGTESNSSSSSTRPPTIRPALTCADIPGAPFAELQARLKKESLFVRSEQQTLHALYDRLSFATEQLMLRAWESRWRQLQIQSFVRDRLSFENWEVHGPGEEAPVSHSKLADALTVLGPRLGAYETLVRFLHDRPSLLAETLMSVPLPWDQRETICRIILFGIYGYYLPPHDDLMILRFLEPLLIDHVDEQVAAEKKRRDKRPSTTTPPDRPSTPTGSGRETPIPLRQMTASPDGSGGSPMVKQDTATDAVTDSQQQQQQQQRGETDNFMRHLSVFTVAFRMMASETAHGYLKATLRAPILAVLASFDRELALEPQSLWSRLPREKQRQFTPKASPSLPDLLGNAAFMSLLQRVHAFVLRLVTTFLESIGSSVSSMPYTLRYAARRVRERLAKAGATTLRQDMALSDLLFRCFLVPAVLSPEALGVVADVFISKSAYSKLQIISRVLSNAVHAAPMEDRRPHMRVFHGRLRQLVDEHFRPFFARVIDVQPPEVALQFAPGAVNHRGRKAAAVFSQADLQRIQHIFSVATQSMPLPAEVMTVLGRLPEPVGAPSEQLFMLMLADPPEHGGVLDEALVLSLCDQAEEQQQNSQNTDAAKIDERGQGKEIGEGGGASAYSAAATDIALGDLAAKLRNALAVMSMNPLYSGSSLLSLLESDLADALAGEHERAGQLRETVRSLQTLPAHSVADGGRALFRALHHDYKRRAVYVNYLVSTRQSLLMSIELVERQTARHEARLGDCRKFHRICKVRRHLESRAKEETKLFVEGFNRIELVDEMCEYLNAHHSHMCEKLFEDAAWRHTSYAEEACGLVRQQLLCAVYDHAFFPHPHDADKDFVFHDHIKRNLAHIMPGHAALQISEEHLSEAPWPLAQEKLAQINAFKTPEEKLACVVACCNAIMDMLHMKGRGSAGADDFFPVLVYVILCANPVHLLSNIQFVEFFGEDITASGQGAYWWAQFSTAVKFIQSIDDRSDPTAFRLVEEQGLETSIPTASSSARDTGAPAE